MDFSLAASYLLLFFTASFLGWCMEVICKLIQFGRFINRGFLIGPWCPIYGFGTVLITLLLSRFTDDPLAVFALAMLLCGTLEYLTSYIMEKAFHARWWDYSAKKFNLNSRVCADTLIPFGLLGLGMIYFVKPYLFHLYGLMSEMAMHPHPERPSFPQTLPGHDAVSRSECHCAPPRFRPFESNHESAHCFLPVPARQLRCQPGSFSSFCVPYVPYFFSFPNRCWESIRLII